MVGGLASGARALDVGGGPGAHAAVWAELGYRAVVLDPGEAMLETAGARTGISAVRGVAQRMPFRPRSFAAGLFHLSIHYGDWRSAVDEALRVVVPGGAVWIWTLGPDHHEASLLGRWFPRVASLDRARFPDPAEMVAYLAERCELQVGRELEVKIRPVGEWAAAVRAGFVSTLQLLSAEELSDGLARFEAANPDPAGEIRYDMRWTWLVARR